MPAAQYFTYDGDPPNSVAPRRPSTDDVGGNAKEDDQAFPPDPVTMPTADGHNQRADLDVGLAKISPVCKISVTFPSGTPGITKFVAVGTLIGSGDLTVTDNGPGDTDIQWPADSFPVPTVEPSAICLNEDVAALAPIVTKISNGINVKTRNSAAALTDIAFTVTIEGQ